MCIYIHIYIQTHTHTHTHTQGISMNRHSMTCAIYRHTYVCIYTCASLALASWLSYSRSACTHAERTNPDVYIRRYIYIDTYVYVWCRSWNVYS